MSQEQIFYPFERFNARRKHPARIEFFRDYYSQFKEGDLVTLFWYNWWIGGNLVGNNARIKSFKNRGLLIEPGMSISSTRLKDDPFDDEFYQGGRRVPHIISSGLAFARGSRFIDYRKMLRKTEHVFEPV